MRLEQKTITTIVADEGKLLVRKRDGWVAGERVTLGYNYYEAGVALSEPRLSKPEDFEEITKPENYEEKPIINHERRMARMAQLIEEEKRLFNQRGLSPKEMIKHKGFAPKWGNDVKEGSEVRRGDKFVFDGKLFAVQKDHKILPHYYPNDDTKSLYVEVTEDYVDPKDELGTIDNPIEYDGSSPLEKGKYYIQEGISYLCNRDSTTPLFNALKDLIGEYVE